MKIFTVTHHFHDAVSRMFSAHGEVEILPEEYGKFNADLIVFTGGEDISPEYYGRSVPEYGWMDSARDKREFKVFKDILSGKIITTKVLGICRGHQLINVGMGGTLVYDIKTSYGVSHSPYHKISWNRDNRFKGIFNSVNSMHHQAIESFGEKLSPTLLGTEPGTRLAEIVLWGTKFLGVQFHPEFMGEIGRKGADVIAGWIRGDNLLVNSEPEAAPTKKSKKDYRGYTVNFNREENDEPLQSVSLVDRSTFSTAVRQDSDDETS